MDVLTQKLDKLKDSVQTSLHHFYPLKSAQQSLFYSSINNSCLKKGWLFHKLEHMLEWQLRWCSMTSDCLQVFTNMDTSAQALCSIPIKTSSFSLVNCDKEHDKNKFVFQVITTFNETLLFSSESSETIDQWLQILKQYSQNNTVFGRSLEEMSNEKDVDVSIVNRNPCICGFKTNNLPTCVPKVIYDLAENIEQRGLNEEGLFRLSGTVKNLRLLCELMNSGEQCNLNEFDVHVVASAFKRLLRELAKPLIPYEFYETIVTVVNRSMVLDADEALASLHATLHLFSPLHLHLLHFISSFLLHVSSHSASNKMTIENLSTIFANAIIRPTPEEEAELLVATVAPRSAVCAVLIAHSEKLFEKIFKKHCQTDDLLGLGEMPERSSELNNKSKSLALNLLGFDSVSFKAIIFNDATDLIDFEEFSVDDAEARSKPLDEQQHKKEEANNRHGAIFIQKETNKEALTIENKKGHKYPTVLPKPNVIRPVAGKNMMQSNGVLLRDKSFKDKKPDNANQDNKRIAQRRSSLNVSREAEVDSHNGVITNRMRELPAPLLKGLSNGTNTDIYDYVDCTLELNQSRSFRTDNSKEALIINTSNRTLTVEKNTNIFNNAQNLVEVNDIIDGKCRLTRESVEKMGVEELRNIVFQLLSKVTVQAEEIKFLKNSHSDI